MSIAGSVFEGRFGQGVPGHHLPCPQGERAHNPALQLAAHLHGLPVGSLHPEGTQDRDAHGPRI
jgi:hypothetical protein